MYIYRTFFVGKCYNPGSPYNGWKDGNDFFEGKDVTFRCSQGYDLIGLQSIRCLQTGQWSGSVPQCKSKLNEIVNAYI